MMIKKIDPKQISDIRSEWDAIAPTRHEVINKGKDISLLFVTAPCILNAIDQESPNSILDVGCGTGYLTSQLAKKAKTCIGIDISSASIRLAQANYNSTGAQFQNCSISDFNPNFKFDVCVSNMVFSSDPDWCNSVQSIRSLLAENGKLLVMLPHPCFWAKYWGFENDLWFKYNEEIYIEHNFSVSLAKSLGTATYIHRPLSKYLEEICSNGFILEEIREPHNRLSSRI